MTFAQPDLTYREAHVIEEACRILIQKNIGIFDGEESDCHACGADLLNGEMHSDDCKVVVAKQIIARMCGEWLPHERG